MAYLATITGSEQTGGNLKVNVSYGNGTSTVLESYHFPTGFSQPVLDDSISRKLANLNAIETTAASVPSGLWTGSPYSPPTPTQAQIDQTTYNTNLALYSKYQVEVALGLRSAADSSVTALKATLLASPAADKTGAIEQVRPTVVAPVSGTYWQATQPVSVASMPSTPVTGAFYRVKTQTVTGDTGVKTATFAGATQTNDTHQGALIFVLVGAVSGTTPTLSCQLQKSYNGGTTWTNLGAAMTSITLTNGSAALMVYPTAGTTSLGSTVAGVATNASLPKFWRLNFTIGGTTPSFALTNVYVDYLL